MWAANAATVAPSADSDDGRVHLTPANLRHMFHRSIEAEATTRVLQVVFGDKNHFLVHDPLPGGGHFADEGAANHMRLATSLGAAHLFAWGRRAWGRGGGPQIHPARQTFEASAAVARLHRLTPSRCIFAQQAPAGIDAGAFHTDVLAVGHDAFFMHHELAFADEGAVIEALRTVLGDELFVLRATEEDLPVARAVAAYPFNSQVLTIPDGTMVIVAPEDAREDLLSRAFLERVASSGGPVRAVHYLDVRQSMLNGGGPACLRLRVPLEAEEAAALRGRVVLDDELDDDLCAWVNRHYRDRLVPEDLGDPALAREGMQALDELTTILSLGSVFDFQRVALGA
jgi:succinylarginine dihydrolase